MRALVALLVAVGLLACGPKKDSAGGGSAAVAPATDSLVLIGMYATSVNFPDSLNGPANLFDSSRAGWATMPGADRLEGVMLYFAPSKAPRFDTLIFAPTTAASTRPVTKLRVFADGAEVGVAEAGKPFAVGASSPSSLDLRIADLAPLPDGSPPLPAGIAALQFSLNGKRVRVVPVAERKGTVTASSSLAPEEAYSTAFLFDGRLDFGWAPGKAHNGVGEWLRFDFTRPVTITKLRIWNGAQGSDMDNKANARAKSISFAADSAPPAKYSLPDSAGAQEIALAAPLHGHRFTLTVDEAFPGTASKDLLISELQFFDGQHWFAIALGVQADEQKRALIGEARRSPLAAVLDRTISARDGTSFAIRSNGSFVIWTAPSGGDRAAVVADGNWRLLWRRDTLTLIDIFGRVRGLTQAVAVSRAGGSAETVRIFEDTLTISPTKIAARKLFSEIEYK